MPVTELVINRPNWLRGEGASDSKLLRSRDGKMCCLGFYSLACGLSRDEILDESEVEHAEDKGVAIPSEMKWLLENYHDAGDLMTCNDDEECDEGIDKEAYLASVFAKHGVTVTFTDEPLAV